MMLKQRWVTIVFLLSSFVTATLQAQGLLPTDWPTKHGTSVNSSSTSVMPGDGLRVMWEMPTGSAQMPLVYLSNVGQRVVSGDSVFDAWTGELLGTLDGDTELTAITTTTDGSGNRKDVLLSIAYHTDEWGTRWEHECIAYDLSNLEQIWRWSIRDESEITRAIMQVTAKDGVFYLVDFSGDFVTAINGLTGVPIWQTSTSSDSSDQFISDTPPIVATLTTTEDETTRVYLTSEGYSDGSGRIIALDGANDNVCWSLPMGSSMGLPCVNEKSGRLFTQDMTSSLSDPNPLVAVDVDGIITWSTNIDGIINATPSLGWASDNDGEESYDAVFAVTGIGKVFAVRQSDGKILWETLLPSWSYCSPLFCGNPSTGKIYVIDTHGDSSRGDTYVLDAMNGNLVQVLKTNCILNSAEIYVIPGLDPYWVDEACSPVIVNVWNGESLQPVMYVLTPSDDPSSHNMLVAWSASGDLYPPIHQPSIVADPAQVLVNSSAQISVTLTDGWNSQPLEAEEIQFACDAGRFEGEVLPVNATTNANGVATTTYHSGKRECVVTITATTSDGTQVQTTVTVSKSVPDDPPPATETGTIQGTVSAGGKPARKFPVQLLQGDATISQTTTNPRGKYTFDTVPIGDYVVQCLSGSEPVTVEAGATVTQDIVLP